jgi:HAD superfamily hydrolase (TIGR01484 family)
MALTIRVLSTDFDGTLHSEHESPPVPRRLEQLIARLQAQGMTWIINTGRDLSSLMETLGRAHLAIWPDYVVAVEREIYVREHHHYVALADWNNECTRVHQTLFERCRPEIPRIIGWIQERFEATVYEDSYSPFCLIARTAREAEQIHEYLEEICRQIPELTVVRNDVYARFSHRNYNKGTALAQIARRVHARPEEIAAAGDHLNDLPMLARAFAQHLIAPANAIPIVQDTVRQQSGYVSPWPQGHGVVDGLERLLPKDSCP